MIHVLFAAVALAAAGPGNAEPQCDVVAQPWAGASMRPAGMEPGRANMPVFAPTEAVLLMLHPDPQVTYVTLPKGGGEESSFGGLAVVRVADGGRYMVGLSEPAWVDVAQHGTASETRTFGRGPACSGIRKGVTFDLVPGDHVVEISGGMTDRIGVIVLPVRPD